ncbi:sugar ABC transporter ATPase [Leucobacter triazinivorans]|uniref:Sugar ABC transporter ATPase n=1 Tax=Leucobacter triazinivorans TaxID=1784719 RepID=A0A4P6KIV4_9MICO|nr:sugar ABC transporter ATPase [Leucobacter triazinivorans]QBE49524.1 sugar ABC transporter ATPase [Leucobacter triazinivorans]
MESTPNVPSDETGPEELAPLGDRDATATEPAADDPAQREWEAAAPLDDAGADASDAASAPAPIPAPGSDVAAGGDQSEVPAADLPTSESQPESQGEDPVVAELGDDGEGDLAPGDR